MQLWLHIQDLLVLSWLFLLVTLIPHMRPAQSFFKSHHCVFVFTDERLHAQGMIRIAI